MRFIVDAQLPPALARFIAAQGHDADHLLDHGMLASADGAIWAYAMANDAVIVTKDEDFALMFANTRAATPRIVWIRVGNCSKRELLARFASRFAEIVATLEAGNPLLELR